jgi:hypothetical protein
MCGCLFYARSIALVFIVSARFRASAVLSLACIGTYFQPLVLCLKKRLWWQKFESGEILALALIDRYQITFTAAASWGESLPQFFLHVMSFGKHFQKSNFSQKSELKFTRRRPTFFSESSLFHEIKIKFLLCVLWPCTMKVGFLKSKKK